MYDGVIIITTATAMSSAKHRHHNTHALSERVTAIYSQSCRARAIKFKIESIGFYLNDINCSALASVV